MAHITGHLPVFRSLGRDYTASNLDILDILKSSASHRRPFARFALKILALCCKSRVLCGSAKIWHLRDFVRIPAWTESDLLQRVRFSH